MIKEKFRKMFIQAGQECVYDSELLSFSKEVLLKNKMRIPSLFRYSPADYNNIRGLETQTLFLSPAGKMNDVFEGLACEINGKVLQQLDRLSDCAYLKSFSEDNLNELMWAHYADSYSGMCVKYDLSKLNDNILCYLFPIYYSDVRRRSQSLEYTIQELIELKIADASRYYPNDTDFLKDIMHLFLTKSKAWEYEKEWRIVATYPQIHKTADDIGDDIAAYYALNNQTIFVNGCIQAVYLGPKIRDVQRNHIIEICKDKLGNIPVYSVTLSKDKYDLEVNILKTEGKNKWEEKWQD